MERGRCAECETEAVYNCSKQRVGGRKRDRDDKMEVRRRKEMKGEGKY